MTLNVVRKEYVHEYGHEYFGALVLGVLHDTRHLQPLGTPCTLKYPIKYPIKYPFFSVVGTPGTLLSKCSVPRALSSSIGEQYAREPPKTTRAILNLTLSGLEHATTMS